MNVPKRKKCAWCAYFRKGFTNVWCAADEEEDLWEDEVNKPLRWKCWLYRFSPEKATEAGWHERKPYRRRPKQFKFNFGELA